MRSFGVRKDTVDSSPGRITPWTCWALQRDLMDDEASYVCDACGEEIIVPVDLTAGAEQEYVEDCPVCCHPCVIQLTLAPDGTVHVSSRPEQDRF